MLTINQLEQTKVEIEEFLKQKGIDEFTLIFSSPSIPNQIMHIVPEKENPDTTISNISNIIGKTLKDTDKPYVLKNQS